MATPPHTLDELIRKIANLPLEKRVEIEELVDAQLRHLSNDRQLAHAVTAASETSFMKVWDTPDDDDYDSL